jgi:hypothetical protein
MVKFSSHDASDALPEKPYEDPGALFGRSESPSEMCRIFLL